MDALIKYLGAIVTHPLGRAGLLIYIVFCASIWLVFDLSPSQEPLTRTEMIGVALIGFVLVLGGILLYSRFFRTGSQPEAPRQDE